MTIRLVILAVSLGSAVPANAADLLDVYRQARTNDPAWVAAQAELRAAQEQRKRALD
jgi:hypothetical protein